MTEVPAAEALTIGYFKLGLTLKPTLESVKDGRDGTKELSLRPLKLEECKEFEAETHRCEDLEGASLEGRNRREGRAAEEEAVRAMEEAM